MKGSETTLMLEGSVPCAWNLQGDATAPAFSDFSIQHFGLSLPVKPNTVSRGEEWTALWLSHRSWLIVGNQERSDREFAKAHDDSAACSGALFDVTHSRTAIRIAGPDAAILLSRGCPLDFHPSVFLIGDCRQSVYRSINVLIYLRDDGPTYTLMVPRSLAADAWRSLSLAAERQGCTVRHPAGS